MFRNYSMERIINLLFNMSMIRYRLLDINVCSLSTAKRSLQSNEHRTFIGYDKDSTYTRIYSLHLLLEVVYAMQIRSLEQDRSDT